MNDIPYDETLIGRLVRLDEPELGRKALGIIYHYYRRGYYHIVEIEWLHAVDPENLGFGRQFTHEAFNVIKVL